MVLLGTGGHCLNGGEEGMAARPSQIYTKGVGYDARVAINQLWAFHGVVSFGEPGELLMQLLKHASFLSPACLFADLLVHSYQHLLLWQALASAFVVAFLAFIAVSFYGRHCCCLVLVWFGLVLLLFFVIIISTLLKKYFNFPHSGRNPHFSFLLIK